MDSVESVESETAMLCLTNYSIPNEDLHESAKDRPPEHFHVRLSKSNRVIVILDTLYLSLRKEKHNRLAPVVWGRHSPEYCSISMDQHPLDLRG